MAGIAGVVGEAESDVRAVVTELAKSLVHSGRTVVETWADAHAGLCRARSGIDNPAPQPVFSPDRTRCLVLFGECFGYEQKKAELTAAGLRFERGDDDAEFCLGLLEHEGERGLASLSGSFCFAQYDSRKRELMLVTDRLGTRSLFYATTADGRLVFGTQVSALLRVPGVTRTLEPRAVVEFCALQRVLGSKTYHQGVQVLPPASVLTWRDGRVTISPYWRMQYAPQPGTADEYAEELAAVLKRSVGQIGRRGARVAMLLSGGLDARMVVAASGSGLECISFGDYMNPEVETARKVAAARGFGFRFLQRGPDHYPRLLDQGVDIGNGMHPFNHAHAIGFVEGLAEQFDVVTHGYVPELMFRGSSMPKIERKVAGVTVSEELDRSLTAANLPDRIFHRGYSLLKLGVERLLQPQAARLLHETLREDAREMIAASAASSGTVYDQFLWPDVYYHGRYPSMLFEHSLRMFMTERSLVFQNEVIDLHLRMPLEVRCDSTVWMKAVARLDRRVAAVANANTGFSPFMPMALSAGLDAAGELAQRLPGLSRLARRAGGPEAAAPGMSPISWPRFDWLVRNNVELRRRVVETLSDPLALPPEIFDLHQVDALLQEHMANRGGHRLLLFALLTFGLWNRRHPAAAT
jgi:asparagine synthase (glutamine-hydrolysing)